MHELLLWFIIVSGFLETEHVGGSLMEGTYHMSRQILQSRLEVTACLLMWMTLMVLLRT